jgi:hypothetical protein
MDTFGGRSVQLAESFIEAAQAMADVMLSAARDVHELSLAAVVDDVQSRCDAMEVQMLSLRDELEQTRRCFAEEIIELCTEDVLRVSHSIHVLSALETQEMRPEAGVPPAREGAFDKAYLRNTVTQFLGAPLDTKRRMVPVLTRLLEFDAREEAFVRRAVDHPS